MWAWVPVPPAEANLLITLIGVAVLVGVPALWWLWRRIVPPRFVCECGAEYPTEAALDEHLGAHDLIEGVR